MTKYFPIVIEREASGAFSAFVPGLPIYAAADTRPKAETAIRGVLGAYLDAHPEAQPSSHVRVAAVRVTAGRSVVAMRSAGALLGSQRSKVKATASRANGKLGGRPKSLAS